jgi:hypothetical protein
VAEGRCFPFFDFHIDLEREGPPLPELNGRQRYQGIYPVRVSDTDKERHQSLSQMNRAVSGGSPTPTFRNKFARANVTGLGDNIERF